MKYKVRDKVRIRKDLVADYLQDPCVNSEMVNFAGQIVTIESITNYGDQYFYYLVKENEWAWTDDMLEDKPAAKSAEQVIEELKAERDEIKAKNKAAGQMIKFRAWDNECKVIREYDELKGLTLEALDASDFELEQSTGLKDANGNMIYENDIIKYFGANKRVKIKTTYGIVFYDSEHGCFNSRIQNEEHNKGGISPLDDLIVGNVHENPELLEARDEQ